MRARTSIRRTLTTHEQQIRRLAAGQAASARLSEGPVAQQADHADRRAQRRSATPPQRRSAQAEVAELRQIRIATRLTTPGNLPKQPSEPCHPAKPTQGKVPYTAKNPCPDAAVTGWRSLPPDAARTVLQTSLARAVLVPARVDAWTRAASPRLCPRVAGALAVTGAVTGWDGRARVSRPCSRAGRAPNRRRAPMTGTDPNHPVAVGRELKRMRGSLETGFSRADGRLALLVQRSDQTGKQLADPEARLDLLKRSAFPPASAAALTATAGVAIALRETLRRDGRPNRPAPHTPEGGHPVTYGMAALRRSSDSLTGCTDRSRSPPAGRPGRSRCRTASSRCRRSRRPSTSRPWPPRSARPGCCGSGTDPYRPG